MSVSGLELVLLLAIALVFLGTEGLPRAARRAGTAIREVRSALWADGDPAAPAPGGAEVVSTLSELVRDPELLGELGQIDSRVTLELAGGDGAVSLDLRSDPSSPASVTASVAPEHAHALLSGHLHEAAELVSGRLAVTGSLRNVLAAIGSLPTLGERYRAARGASAGADPRHAYVRGIQLPPVAAPLVAEGRRVGGGPDAQGALAALLLLSLEAPCRATEVPYLVREGSRDPAALGRAIALVDTLSSVAASDLDAIPLEAGV